MRNTNEEKYINSIGIVETTKKRLSSNANHDMCIDNLLLKIWEEFHESYNRVRFKKPGKVYFFDPGNLHIATKTKVIVETALGEELGEVVAKKKLLPNTELNTPLKKVIRIANYKI